jgi:tetratricopeptide (TPR) repeat protein
MGDLEAAREHWEAARGLWRDIGERRKLAAVENNLGIVAERQDDLDRARRHDQAVELNRQALDVGREIGAVETVAIALTNLGSLAITRGDVETARLMVGEALQRCRELDDLEGTIICLETFGRIRALAGDRAGQVRLIGGASRMRERHAVARYPSETAELERSLRAAQDGLGELRYQDAWREGESLEVDDLIALTFEP